MVEVTADSLYEAVVQGRRAFRENDWVDDVGPYATLTVKARHPEVEHTARVANFKNWLRGQGKSPADEALKTELRALFTREVGQSERRGAGPR